MGRGPTQPPFPFIRAHFRLFFPDALFWYQEVLHGRQRLLLVCDAEGLRTREEGGGCSGRVSTQWCPINALEVNP